VHETSASAGDASGADGWYDGGLRRSCNVACGERGLVCTPAVT
jgi:hypothetical protein